MEKLQRLILFLERLEEKKIYYKIDKIRDSILIEISVPGQKWEVEFMSDGSVEVEKFISTGQIFDESELQELFDKFSDT